MSARVGLVVLLVIIAHRLILCWNSRRDARSVSHTQFYQLKLDKGLEKFPQLPLDKAHFKNRQSRAFVPSQAPVKHGLVPYNLNRSLARLPNHPTIETVLPDWLDRLKEYTAAKLNTISSNSTDEEIKRVVVLVQILKSVLNTDASPGVDFESTADESMMSEADFTHMLADTDSSVGVQEEGSSADEPMECPVLSAIGQENVGGLDQQVQGFDLLGLEDIFSSDFHFQEDEL